MPLMKGRGVKVCKCRSHHRPHLHAPCAIDLNVKHAAVGGALTIVARDIAAAKAGEAPPSLQALAEGTAYDRLDDFIGAPNADLDGCAATAGVHLAAAASTGSAEGAAAGDSPHIDLCRENPSSHSV